LQEKISPDVTVDLLCKHIFEAFTLANFYIFCVGTNKAIFFWLEINSSDFFAPQNAKV